MARFGNKNKHHIRGPPIVELQMGLYILACVYFVPGKIACSILPQSSHVSYILRPSSEEHLDKRLSKVGS